MDTCDFMNSKSSNKAIKAKMAMALNDDMGALSADMKKILIDDLVCAFENRLKVLSKVDSGVTFLAISKEPELINASL
jgi:hypothetical protein